ncbi:hypothetical protein I79_017456 [Cricetulus griseus]|uniref:Uncharacterized protein n=1 Tax=Cricetulus griseus TaxID=10029 RepID=G3I232_CRIGR|nr:hypothetical protein I79_017456 [Cricetulus griseus]
MTKKKVQLNFPDKHRCKNSQQTYLQIESKTFEEFYAKLLHFSELTAAGKKVSPIGILTSS